MALDSIVLIVVGNKQEFAEMEMCLSRLRTSSDLNFEIMHASTFDDGKEALKNNAIRTVSIDTAFPLMTGCDPYPKAGVQLTNQVWAKNPTPKIVIYSDMNPTDVVATFVGFGLPEKKKEKIPLILKKTSNTRHDDWARAVVDTLIYN
jgi:hypothetical protein